MTATGAAGSGLAPARAGDDLARASLALARRFATGGTLWCCSPMAPAHAHHVAVEFVHPVIVGKRALPAVAVEAGAVELRAALRTEVRPGDVVVALAPAHDEVVRDIMRRAPAWGVETIWIGNGERPPAGAADHVLWVDDEDPLHAAEGFVRVYHLLWELTHVCFEHPGLLTQSEECTDEVCITCSDEGRLVEVEAVDGDEAVVRSARGRERVDLTLVGEALPEDLLLVHAGSAIAVLGEEAG